MVNRVYVEKRPGFDIEAQGLLADLLKYLSLPHLTGLRLFNRYDVEGLSQEEFTKAKGTIFSEPNADDVYDEALPAMEGATVFCVEYLPGQFDQRADSAAQCVQLLTAGEMPTVRSARVYALLGEITPEELEAVQRYCVNPVESRLASMAKPDSLALVTEAPQSVTVLDGFTAMDETALFALHQSLGLAMSLADLCFCQAYFRDQEHRDPTITEIRVIDTYWSDHCRHTTFLTRLDDLTVTGGTAKEAVESALKQYLSLRKKVYGDREKDICLMDMATIGAKAIRQAGGLQDLDESEEINACSIRITAVVNGREEPWLVQFKNETHNHPTEIEPFGGAATCLGGAIRDPLSGRAYVYQAMRVTGSANPLTPFENTLAGKLPQRQITTKAAQGYSSYGNQIGIATGQVTELYHPDYVAKRFEVGAVVGACPAENVIRETPEKGDVIILLGGRTGRDGIGGATGSSKEHTENSIETCGAEVQKGNPPTERKLQRLFRDGAVSSMIKRCNDFGAGGVSVAIGELAPSLHIDLDQVKKKYDGLDGTELAISESQERIAVVVAETNAPAFMAAAERENLEAAVVARVEEDGYLTMVWRGETIVRLSRAFLDTNGVTQSAKATITAPDLADDYRKAIPAVLAGRSRQEAFLQNMARLEVCGQHGLVERFDSTIGAGTVLMPFGGKTQLTPEEAMVAKLPILAGETDTATAMAYGFLPAHVKQSPFYGALYAVVESMSKLCAVGADALTARLSLQEYFERLRQDPLRWGKPAGALLGALTAQMGLGVPAIGGKDSMSGSFEDLDVPPSLVSFAIATTTASGTVSASFKEAGHRVIRAAVPVDDYNIPQWEELKDLYRGVHSLAEKGQVLAASVVREGGAAAAIGRMALGNGVGFSADALLSPGELYAPASGDLILEVADGCEIPFSYIPLGSTILEAEIQLNGVSIPLTQVEAAYRGTLEPVFPTKTPAAPLFMSGELYRGKPAVSKRKFAAPRVVIPAFPGTNCEVDSARVFQEAGAIPQIVVMNNLTSQGILSSIQELKAALDQSQILMLPGGFSGGDEPDGSGKFIATTLRNPVVRDAVMELLSRDGLILGVCNGFQALIKTGLIPYGEIRETGEEDPTLTFNTIGRHVSRMARVRVTSTLSPWMASFTPGEVQSVPLSHGEGRLAATEADIRRLFQSGQVSYQYVDEAGQPTMDIAHNPNGSFCAVEGLCSPDGHVMGRMGHAERLLGGSCKNVPGNRTYQMFQNGVNYFK